MNTKAFLGRGMKFPPEVDAATGRFQMAYYEEDIKESIYIILMTQKGERVMLPDFGCNIQDYIYQLPNTTYMNLLKVEVLNALTKWEPRITDIMIEIDTKQLFDAKVIVNISYVIKSTNSADNLVFPYYLNKGADEL
ncbi:MAG: baseplate protein [Clostridia bacterium]|jgi:phage baseplate assembly protein W|nr:baseplate protein [Clostridia bacterium]